MPTTVGDIAQLGIRRRNFIGNTDKYLPTRVQAGTVIEGVRREVGFLDVVTDQSVYNEIYRQTARERLNAYKEGVRFYEGKHWAQEFDDGEKKPVFNFCKTIVDHSVDFFVAKGFNIKAVEGNEDVATAVDIVWKANDKDGLFRKLATMASITGDSYLYITLDTKDKVTGEKLPQKDWRIVMSAIDSFFVFPAFSDTDPSDLKAVLIQFPIALDDKGGVVYKTLFITPTKYQVIQDKEKTEENDNPFGMVPVVHFPNMLNPVSSFGQSDLEACTEINEEYNIVAASIRKIIKYHAEPTTVIFGARASKLEKGAKKVWSGLPIDARVENLAFTSDLGAAFNYLKMLEEILFKTGNIPAAVNNPNMSMNHATGIALRIVYQPLVDKTERKRTAFKAGFKRCTQIIFKALEIIGIDVKTLAEMPEAVSEVYPEFTDPLPFDTVAELDADTKKQVLGVVSVAQLLRKYNPGVDLDRLSTEILADKIAAALAEKAKADALQNLEPNPLAFAVGSVVINADLDQVIEDLKAVIPEPPEPEEADTEEVTPKSKE